MTVLTDVRDVAVLQIVAGRFQRDPSDINMAVFTPEFAYVDALLSSKFPCVGDPSVLAGTDAAFFDRATALMISARLFGPVVAGAAGGTVTAMRTADGTQETYLGLPASSAEEWAKEAAEALFEVSCIKAQRRAAAASFNTFCVTGRTRLLERLLPPWALGFALGLLDAETFPIGGFGLGYWDSDGVMLPPGSLFGDDLLEGGF